MRLNRKKYFKQLLLAYKETLKLLIAKKAFLYNGILAFGVVLFAITTLYAGLKTSNYFSNNSDAIIATHQFSEGVEGNTVALPASHSNVLMMPIQYIQGHLPYGNVSFTALNVGLVFVTLASWAILLIVLFGRKYMILILLLLSSLAFVSVTFNLSIGNSTFRNLAYPIALGFVIAVGKVLGGSLGSHRTLFGTIAATVLFTLVLAGDSFFVYSVILPLLIVITWSWLQSHTLSKSMLRAVGLVVGVVFAAWLLKQALAALDIIYFDRSFLAPPTILKSELLGPSIQVTLSQLLDLQGASIFNRTISLVNAGIFVNFAVLVAGIIGLTAIIRTAYSQFKGKGASATGSMFVFTVMAVSYFVVVLEYILSGYAVTQLEDGRIVSYMNSRYITFLPLITIIGVVWLVKNYVKSSRYLVFICVVLVAGVLFTHPTVSATYRTENAGKAVPATQDLHYIIAVLKENKVNRVVTDFWYGPPLRFLSQDQIQYAPQIGCNRPLSFDSREDWYKPEKGIKSALIIDRGGMNFGYWGCTDEKLIQIYGKPLKEVTASGVRPEDTVKIWIYDYDVRERILPFPAGK